MEKAQGSTSTLQAICSVPYAPCSKLSALCCTREPEMHEGFSGTTSVRHL